MKAVFLKRLRPICLFALMTIVSCVLMVMDAYIVQEISQSASTGGKFYGYLVLAVVVFIVIRSSLFFYQQYQGDKLISVLISDFRSAMLTEIAQNAKIRLTHSQDADSYLSALTGKVDLLEKSFFTNLFQGFFLLCEFVSAVVVALRLNLSLALLVLVLAIPQIIVPVMSKRRLELRKRSVSERIGHFTHSVQDFLLGSQVWKSFGVRDRFAKRTISTNDELRSGLVSDVRTMNIVAGFNEFFSEFLYFGAWLLGGWFVIRQSLSLASLIGFAQVVAMISSPLYSATGTVTGFLGGRAVLKEIAAMIWPQHSDTDSDSAKTISEQVGSFPFAARLEDVTVSVENGAGNKVIHRNLNLTFEKEKKYLIVGPSGIGKSTIFKLIYGEIQPDSGRVYRDKSVGYVPQKVYIFDGTLEENITLFDENPDADRLERVVRLVQLGGMDVHQSVDKESVSGGEMNRIALARALYAGYDFLLIDELSSGLDKATRESIDENLFHIGKNFAYVTHQYDDAFAARFDVVIDLS